MGFLADGELDVVSLRRRGPDDRSRNGWRGGDRRPVSEGGRSIDPCARRRGRRGTGARRGSDLPDRASKVRQRVQLAEQDLDLLAGPVNRPCQDGLVVLRRELPGQAANVRQVRGARGEEVQDHREAAAGAGDGGAGAGRILGQTKDDSAVVEERAEAKTLIEARALLERGEMSDELDRCVALAAGQHDEPIEQVLIRKRLGRREDVDLHDVCVSRPFFAPGEAPGRPQERRAAATCQARRWPRRESRSQRPVDDRGRPFRAAGLRKAPCARENPGPKRAQVEKKSRRRPPRPARRSRRLHRSHDLVTAFERLVNPSSASVLGNECH